MQISPPRCRLVSDIGSDSSWVVVSQTTEPV